MSITHGYTERAAVCHGVALSACLMSTPRPHQTESWVWTLVLLNILREFTKLTNCNLKSFNPQMPENWLWHASRIYNCLIAYRNQTTIVLTIEFSLKKVATIRYKKIGAEEMPLSTKNVNHATIITASIVKASEPLKLLVYTLKFILLFDIRELFNRCLYLRYRGGVMSETKTGTVRAIALAALLLPLALSEDSSFIAL